MVFEKYADYYDTFYAEKDYEAECDFLEKILQGHATRPVRHILDLGCGTGGHALPLARRGYSLTGVDRAPGMLELAREKAGRAGLAVDFVEGDLRQVDVGRTFDAVISMFAVMSYQTTNRDLANAIRTARRHLEPGGLFVFDAWFGPAVLTERPMDRYRIVESGHERIVRFAHPELDLVAQTVKVNYKVLCLRGARVVDEVDEVHVMRFLFAQEIIGFLEAEGFRLSNMCPFMELDRPLTERDWNMTVVAEGV